MDPYVTRALTNAQAARIADLELALDLAMARLVLAEPGDSRAVSDEFVAMACVQAKLTNEECRRIIRAELAALREASERPAGLTECARTREDGDAYHPDDVRAWLTGEAA
jgi:hypothetical protein